MSSRFPVQHRSTHAQSKDRHVLHTKKALREYQKHRRNHKRGFTIIEVITIVVVIGILAAVTVIGLSRYQAESRDAIRGSSTNVIAEALEKYYEENGEYPGCDVLSGPRDDVAKMIGIDPEVLTAPGAASGTNSLRCEGAGDPSDNAYVLTGDGSATCASGSACLFWKIEYTKEGDNSTAVIESRRRVDVATAGTPLLNGSVASSTSTDMSWTAIPNTLNYRLQWSTTNAFTDAGEVTTGATESTVTGLQQGVEYFFRVNSVTATGTSPWSNTHTLTTTVDAPASPSIAAVYSNSNIVGTAGQITCAPGTTPQYQLRSSRTANATPGAYTNWSPWSSSRTLTITNPDDGHRYTLQAQARCVGTDALSNAAQSSTADAIVPIAAPGSVAISASMSGDTATGTVSVISCSTGTTAEYQLRYRTSISSDNIGAWSSYDTWNTTRTRSQTVAVGSRTDFQGQGRCVSAYATGAPGTSSEASTVRAYNAPSGPSVNASHSGGTATGTANVVSCGNGSTPEYQVRTRDSNDSGNYGGWSSWSSWSATNRSRSDAIGQGYRRGYQAQARCIGDFSSSSESAGAEAATVRGIDTPSTPNYTGDTSWEAGYRYRLTYATYCPSGTWVHSDGVQVYSTGLYGDGRYPGSGYRVAAYDDLWFLGWNSGQVDEDAFYYARYRCTTGFATSNYTGERETRMTITCPSHRRSFNASPRCDNHGQNWQTMPYGP